MSSVTGQDWLGAPPCSSACRRRQRERENGCGIRSGGEVELFQECLALTVAEAAEPTGRGDLQFGHDFLCFDLSDLRQRGEYLRDPSLPDYVVGVGVFEDLGQGGAATFEPILEFGANPAGGRGLLQRIGALLAGQLGKCHRVSPSVHHAGMWGWVSY